MEGIESSKKNIIPDANAHGNICIMQILWTFFQHVSMNEMKNTIFCKVIHFIIIHLFKVNL